MKIKENSKENKHGHGRFDNIFKKIKKCEKWACQCIPQGLKSVRIDLRAYLKTLAVLVLSFIVFTSIISYFSLSNALAEDSFITGPKEDGGEAFVYKDGDCVDRSGTDGESFYFSVQYGEYDVCITDPAGNETWYKQNSNSAQNSKEQKEVKKEETVSQPNQQNNNSYTQPVQNNSPEYTKTEEQTTQTKITTTNASTSNKAKAVKRKEVNKKSNKLLSLPFWAIWGFLAFSVCGTSLYFGYRYKGGKNAKEKA